MLSPGTGVQTHLFTCCACEEHSGIKLCIKITLYRYRATAIILTALRAHSSFGSGLLEGETNLPSVLLRGCMLRTAHQLPRFPAGFLQSLRQTFPVWLLSALGVQFVLGAVPGVPFSWPLKE